MISRIRYTFREMWASLSRNLTLTAAAVITSTVSLLLFGGTLLIQRMFDNQLKLWTGGVEMIVYVKHGAAEDQVALIQDALRLLEPGGILIFSNNLRRFQLDREALDRWGALEITNITAATLPKDFARNPRIHNVWRIEWRP